MARLASRASRSVCRTRPHRARQSEAAEQKTQGRTRCGPSTRSTGLHLAKPGKPRPVAGPGRLHLPGRKVPAAGRAEGITHASLHNRCPADARLILTGAKCNSGEAWAGSLSCASAPATASPRTLPGLNPHLVSTPSLPRPQPRLVRAQKTARGPSPDPAPSTKHHSMQDTCLNRRASRAIRAGACSKGGS